MNCLAAGFLLGAGGFVFGCGDDGSRPPVDPVPVEQVVPRALDLLFVVDAHGDGAEQPQYGLAYGFHGFEEALAALPGGMPSLHLGVMSSDLGMGDRTDVCERLGGDEGRIARFSIEDGDPMVLLGTHGCPIEQPLEALRQALDGRSDVNAGFLRDDARLAIVFATNEDDCSVKDTADFASWTTSYRCFERGVRCDGQPPPSTPANLAHCEGFGALSEADDETMWHPQVAIDLVRGLKRDGAMVWAAGVMGPREPVYTRRNDDGNMTIGETCDVLGTYATPAVRLGDFVDAFAGVHVPVCTEDLASAVAALGARLAADHGAPCLVGDVVPDTCTATIGDAPAPMMLRDEPNRCADHPTGLAVTVDRTGVTSDVPAVVTCRR